MSLKQNFISYVESNFSTNPMPEDLTEYWEKFKGGSGGGDKPQFTENGKKILAFLQQNQGTKTWKSKDIAEGMFIASRTVSGAIRKLVTDGYVEKVGQDPVIYSITEKGIETQIIED